MSILEKPEFQLGIAQVAQGLSAMDPNSWQYAMSSAAVENAKGALYRKKQKELREKQKKQRRGRRLGGILGTAGSAVGAALGAPLGPAGVAIGAGLGGGLGQTAGELATGNEFSFDPIIQGAASGATGYALNTAGTYLADRGKNLAAEAEYTGMTGQTSGPQPQPVAAQAAKRTAMKSDAFTNLGYSLQDQAVQALVAPQISSAYIPPPDMGNTQGLDTQSILALQAEADQFAQQGFTQEMAEQEMALRRAAEARVGQGVELDRKRIAQDQERIRLEGRRVSVDEKLANRPRIELVELGGPFGSTQPSLVDLDTRTSTPLGSPVPAPPRTTTLGPGSRLIDENTGGTLAEYPEQPRVLETSPGSGLVKVAPDGTVEIVQEAANLAKERVMYRKTLDEALKKASDKAATLLSPKLTMHPTADTVEKLPEYATLESALSVYYAWRDTRDLGNADFAIVPEQYEALSKIVSENRGAFDSDMPLFLQEMRLKLAEQGTPAESQKPITDGVRKVLRRGRYLGDDKGFQY